MLERTLFGAQSDLEDSAAETFARLMEIRERVVGRTMELQSSGGSPRQQEVLGVFSREMMRIILEMFSQETNSFAKLRDVTESLLRLKERISSEIVASLISVPSPDTATHDTETNTNTDDTDDTDTDDTDTITNTNTDDTTDCDLEEKQHASLLISQLEELTEQQTERTKVLLGLIDLQALMEARLNQLFQADCSTLIGPPSARY